MSTGAGRLLLPSVAAPQHPPTREFVDKPPPRTGAGRSRRSLAWCAKPRQNPPRVPPRPAPHVDRTAPDLRQGADGRDHRNRGGVLGHHPHAQRARSRTRKASRPKSSGASLRKGGSKTGACSPTASGIQDAAPRATPARWLCFGLTFAGLFGPLVTPNTREKYTTCFVSRSARVYRQDFFLASSVGALQDSERASSRASYQGNTHNTIQRSGKRATHALH